MQSELIAGVESATLWCGHGRVMELRLILKYQSGPRAVLPQGNPDLICIVDIWGFKIIHIVDNYFYEGICMCSWESGVGCSMVVQHWD